MIKLRFPIYEKNDAPSEFIPSDPSVNMALQNTEVPNMAYNGATLDDMRSNPLLFDDKHSDLDKIALAQQALLDTVPEVQKVADKFKSMKPNVPKPKII